MTWAIVLGYLAVSIVVSLPCALAVGAFIEAGKGKPPTPKQRDTEWLSTHDLTMAIMFTGTCIAMSLGVI